MALQRRPEMCCYCVLAEPGLGLEATWGMPFFIPLFIPLFVHDSSIQTFFRQILLVDALSTTHVPHTYTMLLSKQRSQNDFERICNHPFDQQLPTPQGKLKLYEDNDDDTTYGTSSLKCAHSRSASLFSQQASACHPHKWVREQLSEVCMKERTCECVSMNAWKTV